MLFNIDSKKISRLNKFFEYGQKGLVVVETSEIPLRNEFTKSICDRFSDASLINAMLTPQYISEIDKAAGKIVLIQDLLKVYGSVEKCCKEINGCRDLYFSKNKIIVFILEPCVVDYLITRCMSFWSCVVLHESLNTISFNPFTFKYILLDPIPKNQSSMSLPEFVSKNFCEKFECGHKCEKFLRDYCFYYSSSAKSYSEEEWLKMCIKLGDYFHSIGEYKDCLACYLFALRKYSLLENHSTLFIGLKIARVYVDMKNLESAAGVLKILIDEEKREIVQDSLCNDLGVVLCKLGSDYQKDSYSSFKTSQKCFEEYNIADVGDSLKCVYYNLSLYYYNIGNLRCASDYSNNMLNLYIASSKDDYVYYFYNEFIRIKMGSNVSPRVEVPLHMLDRLTSIEKSLFYFINAFSFFSSGHLVSAIKMLKKSLSCVANISYKTERERRIIANIYYLKATILFYLNNTSKSIVFFKQARAEFDEINDIEYVQRISGTINHLSNKK